MISAARHTSGKFWYITLRRTFETIVASGVPTPVLLPPDFQAKKLSHPTPTPQIKN